MPDFEAEIVSNFSNFSTKWQSELSTVQTTLATSEVMYLTSYKRLTSLNAWRELLLRNIISPESYGFFCEAQNDAVSSHVLARLGSWRAASQCLRSCIENVFFCEYYKDHAIELRLWSQGQHRLGFSEMVNYFQKHPDMDNVDSRLSGLDRIQREYTVLSRAVHASTTNFRMTVPDGQTNLWTSDTSKLGAWNTRERQTLTGLNLFLIVLHRTALQGTTLPGLRQAIALIINSSALRHLIQVNLGVNLSTTS